MKYLTLNRWPNVICCGSGARQRGSAYQMFERYLALARERGSNAAENFYQHAEHYFRINNARRESNQ